MAPNGLEHVVRVRDQQRRPHWPVKA